MAHNRNPFTGRAADPASALETPGGYVYFDEEDGLLWGDAQLGPGVDAAKLFRQMYNKERPDTYKSYLSQMAEGGSDAVNIEAETAADVLDEATENRVYVTQIKHLVPKENIGLEAAVPVESVEGREIREAQPNLTRLGKGAAKPTAPESISGQKETPETAAARAKSDAQFGISNQAAADQAAADQAAADQAAADQAAADAATTQKASAKVNAETGQNGEQNNESGQ